MRKIALEIAVSVGFVFVGTYLVYGRLAGVDSFWDAQFFWNLVLVLGWVIVAAGYYHQGWLIRKLKTARDVSVVLPVSVFFVQCMLFVKGVYYADWALMLGAVLVNSGVVFSLYQNLKARGWALSQ